MNFNAWLETEQGREELETLTSGPVSEYAATMALNRAWNAAIAEAGARVERHPEEPKA